MINGYGHAMAKGRYFPSRVMKNSGIEVTRWYETGIVPSREYYAYHAMEELEVLPSRALHIGNMWVTRWIETGQFHRVTQALGG